MVGDSEPPRVVTSGLRAPLHSALSLGHCQVAHGVEGTPALARILERRPDPLAGTPSADGPSTEESTTGGRYFGRFPTSESHAKTSSGEASIALLCSYACWATVLAPFVAGSLRWPTNPCVSNSGAILPIKSVLLDRKSTRLNSSHANIS